MRNWQEKSGWNWKLWTEDDFDGLPLITGDRWKQTRNRSEISDILRFEILHVLGGVYLDVDVQLLQTFDVFERAIAEIECGCIFHRLHKEKQREILSGWLMISDAGHPFMRRCCERIAEHTRWPNTRYDSNYAGPHRLTREWHNWSGNKPTLLDSDRFPTRKARNDAAIVLHHGLGLWRKKEK